MPEVAGEDALTQSRWDRDGAEALCYGRLKGGVPIQPFAQEVVVVREVECFRDERVVRVPVGGTPGEQNPFGLVRGHGMVGVVLESVRERVSIMP